MRYPLKVVSLDYRNHSERVFQKDGKIDLSFVTQLDTFCHTFGPQWHTSRVKSCIDRQSPLCLLIRKS